MSLLCIPLRAKNIAGLRRLIKSASSARADVLEIWMDHLPLELQASPFLVRALTNKKLLAVNKAAREKGKWKGSEKERIEVLKKCAAAHFDYIDVGLATAPALIKALRKTLKKPTKLIISHHDFTSTPSEKKLHQIAAAARQLKPDIIKISTHAQTYRDNLTLLNFLVANESTVQKSPLIVTAMGLHAIPTRLLAPLFGSYLNFFALDENQKTVPGQLTVKDYKRFASLLKSR